MNKKRNTDIDWDNPNPNHDDGYSIGTDEMVKTLLRKIRYFDFVGWVKRTIRKWLLDEEYFMGADYGYTESSILVMKRDRRTGVITVLSEYNNKDRPQEEKELDLLVRQLAKKYSVPDANIIKDKPIPSIRF